MSSMHFDQGSFSGMSGMNRPEQPQHQQMHHQQQNNYPQNQNQLQRPPLQHQILPQRPQLQQMHQHSSNPYPLPQYPPNSEPIRQSFSIQNLLQPSPGQHGHHSSNYFGIPSTSTQFSPADHSTPSQPSHTPLGSSIPSMQPAGHTTPSPKRRRLHLHPPVPAGDPSSIVVADMQNESDALHILALASQHGERKNGDDDRGNKPQPSMPDRHDKGKSRADAVADLGDFALVKLGIASKEQVIRLTDIFFKCHHHLLVSSHTAYGADDSQWSHHTSSQERQISLRHSLKASDTS
jgi:hypothetical protein